MSIDELINITDDGTRDDEADDARKELAELRAFRAALRALDEADRKTDAQALAKAWARARELL